MRNPAKPPSKCLACSKDTYRYNYKYCSNVCQQEYEYRSYIERWKEGKEKGLTNTGVVNNQVKRYLRTKYANRCCICGWSKINPKTGLVPLVADHIDGNWRNNVESNLQLICSNCDALSSTYAALNKGNGREHRRISQRAKEARDFKLN